MDLNTHIWSICIWIPFPYTCGNANYYLFLSVLPLRASTMVSSMKELNEMTSLGVIHISRENEAFSVHGDAGYHANGFVI